MPQYSYVNTSNSSLVVGGVHFSKNGSANFSTTQPALDARLGVAPLDRFVDGVKNNTPWNDVSAAVTRTQQVFTATTNLSNSSNGRKVVVNSASAVTLTLLNDTLGSWVDNASFDVLRAGAGAITISAGSGVTIRTKSGFAMAVQYASNTLTRIGANEWVLE